tara:strand:+ start:526 stop:690 length:165 start_codon:yes stop_codon:yes gene_type:complete
MRRINNDKKKNLRIVIADLFLYSKVYLEFNKNDKNPPNVKPKTPEKKALIFRIS